LEKAWTKRYDVGFVALGDVGSSLPRRHRRAKEEKDGQRQDRCGAAPRLVAEASGPEPANGELMT
jgi:hypothetical protein